MTPTPGHRVLYTTAEGYVWPGVVAVVYSDEVVSLCVNTEDGVTPVRRVTFSEEPPGSEGAREHWTWHPDKSIR